MKKIFLIVAIILCNFYSVFTQYSPNNNIYTPNGTKVDFAMTYTGTDFFTSQELKGFQDELSDQYGAAMQIGNNTQTRTYNCYSYAWHMVNNSGIVVNPPVWFDGHPHEYMADCSYVEVYSIQKTQINQINLSKGVALI